MKTSKPYQIFIVDDHQLFLDGIVRILEDEEEFAVVGFFNSGREMLHALNRTVPDLLVLDVQMAGMDGITLCGEVKKRYPEVKVLFVSMFELPRVVQECQSVGAAGFLPKTSDASTVKATIRQIISGETVFMPLNKKAEKKQESLPPCTLLLSHREKEIISLIKAGNTSKTIAEILSISEYTVQTHRRNIFKKLKLTSVSELISFGHDNGL